MNSLSICDRKWMEKVIAYCPITRHLNRVNELWRSTKDLQSEGFHASDVSPLFRHIVWQEHFSSCAWTARAALVLRNNRRFVWRKVLEVRLYLALCTAGWFTMNVENCASRPHRSTNTSCGPFPHSHRLFWRFLWEGSRDFFWEERKWEMWRSLCCSAVNCSFLYSMEIRARRWIFESFLMLWVSWFHVFVL